MTDGRTLSTPPRARRGAVELAALLALAGALRLALGHRFFGFLTGDDVEILESGLRPVLGLAFRPWEIRDPLLPALLVTPLAGLARALGVESPRALVWIASWPFVGLSLANLALLHALVRRWGGSARLALLAAALYASHWIPAGLASMVYPRTASTTCVLGAALLLAGKRGPRAIFVIGALLALAFAVRYSEAVFLLPVAAIVAREGPDRAARRRRLTALAAGFAAGALLFVGLPDRLEWGSPFASLVAFARYTLFEERSSSLAPHQPPWWYLWRLPHWICPAALPALALALRPRWLRSLPAARQAWGFVLLPVAALSLVHHKELRYLQGVLPFVAALSALGLVEVARASRKWVAVALALLTSVWGLAQLDFLAGKSMAAVEAANALAADPDARSLAAVQPWAFGDRLYLPQRIAVREIPSPVAGATLVGAIAGADRVALYERDLLADPGLEAVLGAAGFGRVAVFRHGESPAVELFARVPAGDR